MKTTFSILLCFMIMAIGCSDESDTPGGDMSVIGKWQMTESYVSPGGKTKWQKVDDGDIHHFKVDSTFTSNGLECPEGVFFVKGDSLQLEFNCDYPTENKVMKFRFEGQKLILTPVSPVMCIEGCLYKYERID